MFENNIINFTFVTPSYSEFLRDHRQFDAAKLFS